MDGLDRLHVPAAALAALCREFGVVELAAFGSVLREDFGADSDVDLLAVFERPVGLFACDRALSSARLVLAA